MQNANAKCQCEVAWVIRAVDYLGAGTPKRFEVEGLLRK